MDNTYLLLIISILFLIILVIMIFIFKSLANSSSKLSSNGEKFHLDNQIKDLEEKINKVDTNLQIGLTKTTNEFNNSTKSLKEFFTITSNTLKESSEKSIAETQKLTNLLNDNSKRGAWAEKIAEDLLKSIGMIEGVSYEKQTKLSWKTDDDKDLKPDFTFKIDGQEKLFIMDSKFPLANYQKMYDKDGAPVFNFDSEKKAYISSVRKRIDEVKKYINTSENTIDLAAMFVPIPTILDETLQMDNDIVDYAISQKVVLVSPANFYALISFLHHTQTLFKVTKEQEKIIKTFGSLRDQWGKYEDSFEKIEQKLQQLTDSISHVKNTRTNAMTREMNKVDDILSLESKKEED